MMTIEQKLWIFHKWHIAESSCTQIYLGLSMYDPLPFNKEVVLEWAAVLVDEDERGPSAELSNIATSDPPPPPKP